MTTAPADQRGSLTFLDMRFYDMIPSPGFEAWLAEQRVSLALTCSGSRLFLIGLKPDQRLSVFDCSFDRCLGLVAASPEQLYMVTRYQIWRLENALQPGQQADGEYDRLYIPQVAYTTGGLNIHDLALDARGARAVR